MDMLRCVRSLNLPDWFIAAGTIRNTVRNTLHNFPSQNNQKDVDVAFCDLHNLDPMQDKIIEKKLAEKMPSTNWEVVNQAHAHKMNEEVTSGRTTVDSSTESIAYWSETPTCVGVRLEGDDSLTICAPHGLKDLFNLEVNPVPPPYESLQLFKYRMNKKQWQKTWPKLKIKEIIED